jgi:predicted GH43/DUF377 family glycosyl hydrolase
VKVQRHTGNPIIAPADVKPSRDDFEVIGVFNAGAARLGGETVLLLRAAERPLAESADEVAAAFYDPESGRIVKKHFARNDPKNDFSDARFVKTPSGLYLTSISHLRVARSADGVNFKIEEKPALEAANEYETFGLEDPRISLIDGVYYISYVAVSRAGVVTCLASTRDFLRFQRRGVIFCPENKDAAIFEGKVAGRYFALHRPVSPLFAAHDVWIAESPDLLSWGNHRRLFGTRKDSWDELRIGAGAPPVKTGAGWLEIYHGADRDQRYCLGAVLLDAEKPWEVLARSAEPVLRPELPCEKQGFFGEVVFTCGVLLEDGMLKIYYGAADTSICLACAPLEEITAGMC